LNCHNAEAVVVTVADLVSTEVTATRVAAEAAAADTKVVTAVVDSVVETVVAVAIAVETVAVEAATVADQATVVDTAVEMVAAEAATVEIAVHVQLATAVSLVHPVKEVPQAKDHQVVTVVQTPVVQAETAIATTPVGVALAAVKRSQAITKIALNHNRFVGMGLIFNP